MLVRVSNVTVTQGVIDDFLEWYVDDGSGECKIDDTMFDGQWPEPAVGQQYDNITGVVDYGYGEFGILPRTMSDIIVHPDFPVVDAGDDQLIPPGATATLDGSGSYDPGGGSLIAYEWQQLSGTGVTLGDEEAEITTFTAPQSEGNLVFRLTVYNNDFLTSCDEVIIEIGIGVTIPDIQCPDDMVMGNYCYETPLSGSEDACEGAGGIVCATQMSAGTMIEISNYLDRLQVL